MQIREAAGNQVNSTGKALREVSRWFQAFRPLILRGQSYRTALISMVFRDGDSQSIKMAMSSTNQLYSEKWDHLFINQYRWDVNLYSQKKALSNRGFTLLLPSACF